MGKSCAFSADDASQKYEEQSLMPRLRILWIHNNQTRQSGSFMWDLEQAFCSIDNVEIEQFVVPIRPKIRDVVEIAKRVRKYSKEFDIVHAQYGSFVGLCALASQRPTIVSLRGSDIYGNGSWRFSSMAGGVARVLFSLVAAAFSDAVVVMSDRMRSRLSSFLPWRRRDIHVIQDPAAQSLWDIRSQGDEHCLESPGAKIIFASLNKNNALKREWIVRRAAALANAADIGISLTVLSGMPRDKVLDAMIEADAIALASTHEGWPNVIKEGLLLGKGFVATDVSDLLAFRVRDEPRIICAPTPISFACAFVELAYWRRLRASGLAEFSMTSFYPACAARKTLVLYRSLAE